MVELPTAPGQLAQLTPAEDILGECPIWSPKDGALYWIDVRAPAIRRLQLASGKITSWPMPELIGAMALRPDGCIIVALRSGVAIFDPAGGTVSALHTLHQPDTSMRLNDGKCDRQGRFWVGSMDDVGRGPVGTLYRIGSDGCTGVLSGVAVPNSLCWSPDGCTMYFADGVEPIIWAYPFDTEAGTLGARRVFARLPPGTGIPDGATVDSAGRLWSANYGGGCITCYAPDGKVEKVLAVPVTQPTSCAFGGPSLDILFITTATQRLTAVQRSAEPLAGSVLAVRADGPGLPEPMFAI